MSFGCCGCLGRDAACHASEKMISKYKHKDSNELIEYLKGGGDHKTQQAEQHRLSLLFWCTSVRDKLEVKPMMA